MTGNEQAGPSERPPLTLRRPGTPNGQVATVTRLGERSRRSAPVAMVQGTLALDLTGDTGMPETPELRVVHGAGELTAWAGKFAQAVVEVLGGDRALPQLVRWTSGRVYSDLNRRVRILGRTSPAGQRLRTVRPQVRSVHVFQPTADTAEISVHVRHGQRSRAIAARLELVRDRWQCTELQLG